MQNDLVVPRTGLEPARLSTLAPETSASTIPPPGQSTFERKTRLELATPTLARLCSTNWAISAFVSQTRHFRLRSLRESKLSHSLARKFRINFIARSLCVSFNECKGSTFFRIHKTFEIFFTVFFAKFSLTKQAPLIINQLAILIQNKKKSRFHKWTSPCIKTFNNQHILSL